jgi:hypothetical protein
MDCASRSERLARVLRRLVAVSLVVACASSAKDEPGTSGAADAVQRATPDSLSLPRTDITIADRARWLARLHWPNDCEQAFALTQVTDDGGLHFHEVEPGLSLVIVRCALGAYQPTHIVLRVDERQAPAAATVLDFPTFTSSDGKSLVPTRAVELAGEVALLDGGRALTVLSLARQIGDCGTWARYRLGDGSGAPELELFAERVACPGAPGQRVIPAPGLPPDGWRRVTPA